MTEREKIVQFLQDNFNYMKVNYHILKIGLIGSLARGEQTEKSDIDLLVEFEPDTKDLYELKIRLKQYIRSNLNRNVDICREKYLKPYIKDLILKEAIYV